MFRKSATRRLCLTASAVAAITLLAMVQSAPAANSTWTSNSSTDWYSAANWSDGVPGGGFTTTDIATFNDGATQTTITQSSTSIRIGQISISGTQSYNFNPSAAFYFTNALAFTNSSTGNTTFTGSNSSISFRGRRDGDSTFQNTGGLVTFNNPVLKERNTSVTAGNLIFDGSGNLQVESLGKRYGDQTTNLVKNGAGTLTITNFETVFSTTGTAISGLTGTTTVNAGTIRVTSGDSRSLGYSPTNLSNWLTVDGGTLQVSTSSLNLGANSTEGVSLGAGNGSFNVDSGLTLTVGGAGGVNLISGGGTLTKIGDGTLTLAGANTYTGATNINAGTLALSGTGSIADSSRIEIGSGATFDITGLSGSFSLGANQTLSGTGTLLATGQTIVASGTLSPGNSPGTAIQDGGVLQLAADANYNWQVYDASGVAGTGYDTTSLINGATLDLSALSSGNPYNVNLWSLEGIGPDVNGDAINFNSGSPYSWTLFSQDSSISGFSADLFAINVGANNGTSGFSNDLGGGNFTVSLNGGGNAIMLNFIPVPEPAAMALAASGLLGLAAYGARRRKR
jgi:autotransporter-associated beta strand protein